MAQYTKPFLTYEEQADKLIKRGLIADKNKLIEILKHVGYYRFSGYLYQFRTRDNKYIKGTTLEQVYEIYRFDRQLRLLTLDAIERFEIQIRTNLAYKLTEAYGPFSYNDKDTLPNISDDAYNKLLDKCRRNYHFSKEPFIDHFKKEYGNKHNLPPYGILINLFDFGMVCTLFRGSDQHIRYQIAHDLNINASVLQSGLLAINTVRNICAHHARIGNKRIAQPKLPRNDQGKHIIRQNRTIYPILTILNYSLNIIAPNTSGHNRLSSLFKNFPNIDLRYIGFPENGQKNPVGKNKSKQNNIYTSR